MKKSVTLDDISIRTSLKSGDIGYVIYLHGKLYRDECGYGLDFEAYVAQGLYEFYKQYDAKTNRVWVCEYQDQIIGFLTMMNRGDAAQLRYFLLLPAFRGIGLGNKLMDLYMDSLRQCGFKKSYLLTTHELHPAAHLYTKNGFKLVEEKDSSLFGKPLKEQRYELELD